MGNADFGTRQGPGAQVRALTPRRSGSPTSSLQPLGAPTIGRSVTTPPTTPRPSSPLLNPHPGSEQRYDLTGTTLAMLPRALVDLQRQLAVDEVVSLCLTPGPAAIEGQWSLLDVLEGAGFTAVSGKDAAAGPAAGGSRYAPRRPDVGGGEDGGQVEVWVRRARTLADRVGPNLKLLLCGLNPSLYAADRGVAFARPGNRFWPSVLGAGLASRDRDPDHAWNQHRIGFTDLVKRASHAAAEIEVAEYRLGLARVERMVAALTPDAVCLLGLSGFRAVIDRRARAGPLAAGIGGRPAYLMPNPSGLNAHSQVPDLIAHMRAAASLGASSGQNQPH